MQFLIADTFTDSLSRLTEDERKAAELVGMGLSPTKQAMGVSR